VGHPHIYGCFVFILVHIWKLDPGRRCPRQPHSPFRVDGACGPGEAAPSPSTASSVATIALIQVGLLRRAAGPAVFRCPSRDAARSAWWPETRREQVAARYRRGNFVEAAESELPRSSLADSGPTNVRCCCWRQATDSPAKVAACAVVRSVQVEPAQDLAGLAGVVGVPRDQVRNIRVLDRPAQLRALGRRTRCCG
jgi:hypothetical protein